MLDLATEMVRKCESIVLRLGIKEGHYRVYRDGKIQIRRALHSRELEVVLFPPFTRAKTGNPAIMVDEVGVMFRWHGEVCNARGHIRDLYRSIPGNENLDD